MNNVFSVNPWDPTIINIPTAAWLPYPADGAKGVNKSGVTLTWAAGAEATSHIVYFGPNNPPALIGEQAGTSLATGAMLNATTYYWQVDKKNSAGTTTGKLWSFTTADEFETAPPSPDPMTLALTPYPLGISIILVTATTAADDSGVEYYFTNVTDPNHNSGWQNSPVYIDNGLVNNTTYTYKVKARDKSPSQNETADSNEDSATTLRYYCEGLPVGDFDEDCRVNFKDYWIFVNGWGEPNETADILTNGTFDTNLTPWQLVTISGQTPKVTATFDDANGEPAGSARLDANTTPSLVSDHRFYQIIPVTVGNKYRFSGRWSGFLFDQVDPGGRNNKVEVLIGFSSNTNPLTINWGDVYYIKKFLSKGSGSNMNFPSDSNGTWGWEDILASPNNGPVPPVGDVYTAINPYMVVSVNLGGNANGGRIKAWLDNFRIYAQICSPEDLNGDCSLNMKDLAKLAQTWLSCNRTPSSECWK